jgi:predicted nucleic-acid-binding Zn-ribbon protein
MNTLQTCPNCNSTNMESGTLGSTGKIHFRPEDAKFLKLKTANVDVAASLCMDCGYKNGQIRGCIVVFGLYGFCESKLGHFDLAMSLYLSFNLCQFCSPLFCFFWLVPGFVKFD